MSRWKVSLAATALMVIGTGGQHMRAQQNLPPEVLRYADIVFVNGPVLTMDKDTPDFTVAQAVAVRDGRILAVGDSATILRMAGPKTRKIDLAGKAVMPGVVDTHSHPNRYALNHYQSEFLPGYMKWLKDNKIHTGSVRWETGQGEGARAIESGR